MTRNIGSKPNSNCSALKGLRSSTGKRTSVAKAARSGQDGSLLPKRVRILLRRRKSDLYCQNAARWSPKAGEAFDFLKVEEAVKFARDSHLEAVDMVLDFEDGQGHIIVPILRQE